MANTLDMFDVGLDSTYATDSTLLQLQHEDIGYTLDDDLSESDLQGLGFDDPVIELQRMRELERKRNARIAIQQPVSPTKPVDATRLDAIDTINTTPPNPNAADTGSIKVDLGDTEDNALKAKIAMNALGAEIDAITKQAKLEEHKREAVVDALKGAGFAQSDANSIYNKIPEEFKRNVSQLHAMRRAQERFNGQQPNAVATFSRNLISALYGDPTQAPVDRAYIAAKRDIEMFKGANEIRTAMISAIKEENPVFSNARTLALEEKAAATVRTATPVLLASQGTVAARRALVENYRLAHPGIQGSDTELYEMALADKLKEDAENAAFERDYKNRSNELRKMELDSSIQARKDAIKENIRREGIAEDVAWQAQEYSKKLADYKDDIKETDEKRLAKLERTKQDHDLSNQIELEKTRFKIQEKLNAKSTTRMRLDFDIKQARLKDSRVQSKKVDDFMGKLMAAKARVDAQNKQRPPEQQVRFPPALQAVLDGTEKIATKEETIEASMKPLLVTIMAAEAGAEGFNAANSPALKGKQLTGMTIGGVRKLVKATKTKGSKGSDAVGAFQMIGETFKRAQKGAGLSDNDLFDAKNQKAMAMWLLVNETNALEFLSSNKTTEDLDKFQNSVARVWAGIPVATDMKRGNVKIKSGESYYMGVSKEDYNAATVSSSAFRESALRMDIAQPLTLQLAEALLVGTATENEIATKNSTPAAIEKQKVDHVKELRMVVSSGLGYKGADDILPETVILNEDGSFAGSMDAAVASLEEMSKKGYLLPGHASMVGNLSKSLSSIVEKSGTDKDKIVFAGNVPNIPATLAKPLKTRDSLSTSYYNPVGVVTKHPLGDIVNKLTLVPSVNDILWISYKKYDRNVKEAAAEVRKYLMEVGRTKAESPVSAYIGIGSTQPPLKLKVSQGALLDYLVRTGKDDTIDISNENSASTLEALLNAIQLEKSTQRLIIQGGLHL